jgi:hypothetical protein
MASQRPASSKWRTCWLLYNQISPNSYNYIHSMVQSEAPCRYSTNILGSVTVKACWSSKRDVTWTLSPLMSLVLVYAGPPTIFANFRTFIRLYLIIFHHYIGLYITTLCHNSMSCLYLATLCRNSTLHFYATSTSHRYCLAPLHHHRLVSLHVTSQVIGPSRAVRLTTP